MSDRPRSRTRPADRQRRSDPARTAAYLTLRAVADGAYANLELGEQQRRARLSGRDAAFCTELTHGTLRMRGLYDPILAVAARREVAKIDEPVLDVLRLGVHQLLAMRVPDHAAVSATVAVARQEISQGSGGFVNAVLRRVSERDRAAWVAEVTTGLDEAVDILAREHSHPVWVVRALRAALLTQGESTPAELESELSALLAANNDPGPLTVAARPGLQAEGDLTAAGATPSNAAPTAWTWSRGNPADLAPVRDGRAAVQDAGSQLVAAVLLEAEVEGVDTGQWLDLCAGPGGKTGLLAAAALARGARLSAHEVAPHRAELVRKTLEAARLAGAQVEVTTGDGTTVGREHPDRFDRVLVDAPCTGLGALRRRPEARWRRQPGDLVELAPLQRGLLASALQATRPGGVVVYATCSPHIAETALVVQDAMMRSGSVTQLDARPLVRHRDGSAYEGLGPGPGAQLFTHRHGTDAMFVCLLRRT
ncbi:MAG TPA: transcription antitermination factor NusB [Ornithinimicrobium sp.]|uniref:RsmB/NOP family class I SAM-dependent RNA methyltransferase n=1 Tax=Ornithinimicrobium sp. TaxID=1977084 RepID=UPI002B462361|nr:transcription antitermination factor NusB [Ornithinimicrobium sp.]HKJ11870.1 transcription antitermination factor NusB [Ornithinimicrobium sp.]